MVMLDDFIEWVKKGQASKRLRELETKMISNKVWAKRRENWERMGQILTQLEQLCQEQKDLSRIRELAHGLAAQARIIWNSLGQGDEQAARLFWQWEKV